MSRNKGLHLFLVISTAAVVTLFHYITDPHAGAIHDALQRFYYVPIVLAGLWFGVRGGLLTAFLITVAYFPHARHGWHAPYGFIFQGTEMVMYHIIGALCGFMSSRERRSFEAEHEARQERERALQDLQERTRELFDLEEQLRRTDRLAALGTLSAGLAHEIRNPLGSIKTSGEMLREILNEHPVLTEHNSDENNTPDFVGIIMEESDRLNQIVTNFLEFARQEKQETPNENELCDVNEAIERTVDLLRLHAEKRNVEFLVGSVPREARVPMSASRLQQILLNLFLNAMEAIGSKGHIKIDGAMSNDSIDLRIEDSGPGIPENQAAKIFDPFVTTKEGGTGLGLSIVERIVTNNGGTIALDREHKPLNRFVITFPLAR